MRFGPVIRAEDPAQQDPFFALQEIHLKSLLKVWRTMIYPEV